MQTQAKRVDGRSRPRNAARRKKHGLRWVRLSKSILSLVPTDWFKGSVKPVHPGIYRRKFKGGLVQYSRWTGQYWCIGDENISRAYWRQEKSEQQCRPWYGVTENL